MVVLIWLEGEGRWNEMGVGLWKRGSSLGTYAHLGNVKLVSKIG
jgi:hypothetical protein